MNAIHNLISSTLLWWRIGANMLALSKNKNCWRKILQKTKNQANIAIEFPSHLSLLLRKQHFNYKYPLTFQLNMRIFRCLGIKKSAWNDFNCFICYWRQHESSSSDARRIAKIQSYQTLDKAVDLRNCYQMLVAAQLVAKHFVAIHTLTVAITPVMPSTFISWLSQYWGSDYELQE